jgi:hypothetical protein
VRSSLIILLICSAVTLAAPRGARAQSPPPPSDGPAWNVFKDADFGAAAEMPSPPQRDIIPGPEELAKFSPRTIGARGSAVVCAILRLDVPTLEGPAKGAFLDAITRDLIVKNTPFEGASVHNVEAAILDQQPAKQFVVEVPARKLEVIGRVALCGARCYIAIAGGAPLDHVDSSRFFDSIRLLNCGSSPQGDRDRDSVSGVLHTGARELAPEVLLFDTRRRRVVA